MRVSWVSCFLSTSLSVMVRLRLRLNISQSVMRKIRMVVRIYKIIIFRLMTREIKQSPKQLDQTEEEEGILKTGFDITVIPEESTNQTLQLRLLPYHEVYVFGDIIYSNIPHTSTRSLLSRLFHRGEDFVANQEKFIAVLGVKRRNGGGKILVLSSDIYGSEVYFDPSALIMCNLSQQLMTTSEHSGLASLICQKPTDEEDGPVGHVLQAPENSRIIEKYLGKNEKWYVRGANPILCVTHDVKIKQIGFGRREFELEGQGWVFMQEEGLSRRKWQAVRGATGFILLILIFILVGLTIETVDILLI